MQTAEGIRQIFMNQGQATRSARKKIGPQDEGLRVEENWIPNLKTGSL
jgi:hypothetical protein